MASSAERGDEVAGCSQYKNKRYRIEVRIRRTLQGTAGERFDSRTDFAVAPYCRGLHKLHGSYARESEVRKFRDCCPPICHEEQKGRRTMKKRPPREKPKNFIFTVHLSELVQFLPIAWSWPWVCKPLHGFGGFAYGV